jgi:hypothetical protein
MKKKHARAWVNHSPHFSNDDFHFAFGNDAVEDQLDIFKKISSLPTICPATA